MTNISLRELSVTAALALMLWWDFHPCRQSEGLSILKCCLTPFYLYSVLISSCNEVCPFQANPFLYVSDNFIVLVATRSITDPRWWQPRLVVLWWRMLFRFFPLFLHHYFGMLSRVACNELCAVVPLCRCAVVKQETLWIYRAANAHTTVLPLWCHTPKLKMQY